jgi:hypothetical protein
MFTKFVLKIVNANSNEVHKTKKMLKLLRDISLKKIKQCPRCSQKVHILMKPYAADSFFDKLLHYSY